MTPIFRGFDHFNFFHYYSRIFQLASISARQETFKMQIWHMDPYGFGDRRMPHFSNIPPKMLTIDQLYSLAKVTHYKVGFPHRTFPPQIQHL